MRPIHQAGSRDREYRVWSKGTGIILYKRGSNTQGHYEPNQNLYKFNGSRIISSHLQGADVSTKLNDYQDWRILPRSFWKITSNSDCTSPGINFNQYPTTRPDSGQKFGIHKYHHSSIKNTIGNWIEGTGGLGEVRTSKFDFKNRFKISVHEGLVV